MVRSIASSFLLLGLSGAAAVSVVGQPAVPSELDLELEAPETRQVHQGVPEIWRVPLEEGLFAELEILAAQAKIVLRLIDPAGTERQSKERNYESSPYKLRWIADLDGLWRVEISTGEGSEEADYSIHWKAVRVAGSSDRQLLRADGLVEEASSFFEAGTYGQAEPLMRQALELYEEALGPDHLEVASCLNGLATLSQRQGRYAVAEPLYQRALTIRESSLGPEHPQVADTLIDLAVLFWRQGRYAEAEPLYKRVTEIDEKTLGPNHPFLANGLNNLGVLYWRQGRYREAEALHQRALTIREQALGPEHPRVASSLNNLAVLYDDQGRYAEAEPLLLRVVEIDRKTVGPEHPNLGESLDNLAAHYRLQERYEEAEPLHRQALEIREKALGPDHPRVATSLNNLSALLNKMERYSEAEPLLRRALALQEEALGPEHPDVTHSLNNLAHALVQLERYQEAEPLLQRSMGIAEKALGTDHPAVAQSLIAQAEIAQKRQLPEVALPLLDRAIRILDGTSGFPGDRIRAYADRARILKALGRLAGALDDLEEALLTAEEMRPQAGGGEATRAAFFQRYSEEFSRMVSWQLEAGNLEAALEYAERGRARVLLDQLQAGKIDLRAGIAPEIRGPLEEREAVAQARMAEFQQRLTLLRGRRDLSDSQRGAEVAEVSQLLRAAHEEFSRIYAEIKNASPLWRDLITSGGQPVELRQLQRRIVPERGLLLLYQLGPEDSHLFVVGSERGDARAFSLEIGPEVGGLLGLPPGPLTISSVGRLLGADLGLFFTPSGNIEPLQEQLHGLWQVLVPEGLGERLLEAAEVVLVPDGALRNLPFEALLIQPGETWSESRFWLDEGPPIRYAPSATALYNIQRRPAAIPSPGPEGAILVSLADPFYDPMEESPEAEPNLPREVTRDAYVRAGGPLARLPGTARESDAIMAHFGPQRVTALRQRQATELNLRSSLQGRRYLHLATHGLVDERRGSLFAALAMTPPATEKASSDNDGFLQLYEVYELDLSEAELAVLSACETSVGSAVQGEGVFALSRGFLAAGARRVIASHWAVDDASTAELMGAAFARIAEAETQASPLDYAEVLREAKRRLRRNPLWSAPFYWAPFTLTGKR